MTTVYAADHASALADVREAGAAVTFTRKTPGTLDEATGLHASASATTIAAYAIDAFAGSGKTPGVPVLKENEELALFCVPVTIGQLPAPSDTVTWNSITYIVRRVLALQPDGTPIAATVMVGR
jgi:hypothetical protein